MTQRRIYQNDFPYFVTFRTSEGAPFFENTEYAESLSRTIFQAGNMKGHNILSFQIMPDHVHVLVHQATAGAETRGGNNPQAHLSAGARGDKHASAATESRARVYDISQFMYSMKSFFVHQMRDEYGVADQSGKNVFIRKLSTRQNTWKQSCIILKTIRSRRNCRTNITARHFSISIGRRFGYYSNDHINMYD